MTESPDHVPGVARLWKPGDSGRGRSHGISLGRPSAGERGCVHSSPAATSPCPTKFPNSLILQGVRRPCCLGRLDDVGLKRTSLEWINAANEISDN